MESNIIVHAHPIIELQIKNCKYDEVGKIAECVLYNKETNKIESSFFLTDEIAIEIMKEIQKFINFK